jgi:hypothetical protein
MLRESRMGDAITDYNTYGKRTFKYQSEYSAASGCNQATFSGRKITTEEGTQNQVMDRIKKVRQRPDRLLD